MTDEAARKAQGAEASFPGVRNVVDRPSAEQVRAVAAAAGHLLFDRRTPLTAQPVLLVEGQGAKGQGAMIWLPDGTPIGAVVPGTGSTTLIVDDRTVVVSMESPRRFFRARGEQSVRDSAGHEPGVTHERGSFRRDLLLTSRGGVQAQYRRHGLRHATIIDDRGNLLADITRRRVRYRWWPFDSVFLVRHGVAFEDPLRTLVFANAVTAFLSLQTGYSDH